MFRNLNFKPLYNNFTAIDNGFKYFLRLDCSKRSSSVFIQTEKGRKRKSMKKKYRPKIFNEGERKKEDRINGFFEEHGLVPIEVSHPLNKKMDKNVPTAFAVASIGSHQFKVTLDDIVVVTRRPLEQAPVGKVISVTDVLMVGTSEKTVIGRPVIGGGAQLKLLVQEHSRNKRGIAFKRKKRKRYMRWHEYRHNLTIFRVNEIICPQLQLHLKTERNESEKSTQFITNTEEIQIEG